MNNGPWKKILQICFCMKEWVDTACISLPPACLSKECWVTWEVNNVAIAGFEQWSFSRLLHFKPPNLHGFYFQEACFRFKDTGVHETSEDVYVILEGFCVWGMAEGCCQQQPHELPGSKGCKGKNEKLLPVPRKLWNLHKSSTLVQTAE